MTIRPAQLLVGAVVLGGVLTGCDREPGPLDTPDATAPGDAEADEFATYEDGDGRYRIDVPGGWAVDDVGGRLYARPSEDAEQFVTVLVVEDPDLDLDAALKEVPELADAEARETVDVPGADEAVRLEHVNDAGLEVIVVVAQGDDGIVIALVTQDAEDPLPEALVDGVLGSLDLSGAADA